jgi:hypothetical protein
MINEQRQAELEQSCELWSSAYDRYYFEMDDDEFEDAMSDIGDDYQNDPVYQAYLRQRKIGFEAYQREVNGQIAALCSADELHFIAEHHNWDDGTGLMLQIAKHPKCSFPTAKLIYWNAQPEFIYEKYGSPSNEAGKEFQLDDEETALLLAAIEQRTRNDSYIEHIDTETDLSDFDAPDYRKQPFDKIPEALRI